MTHTLEKMSKSKLNGVNPQVAYISSCIFVCNILSYVLCFFLIKFTKTTNILRHSPTKQIEKVGCEWKMLIKGLLTKSGYITNTKKNNWKLYTNNSYIIAKSSNLKKIKCSQDISAQS